MRGELRHHGILNQKWGVRNGPPYPLGGGDYSKAEKQAIYKERKSKNSIYNKKHFDRVLSKEKTTLSTLSYDKDRLKGADMFYATHTSRDKAQYGSWFNHKIKKDIVDENGNVIGSDKCFKFKIDTSINNDLKVASEDSGAKIFMDLYTKNRDFYNFVTDKTRMREYFCNDRYKFRGYRESRKALENIERGKMPSEKDMTRIYRMFNYVIPYDGQGNERGGHDMAVQRAKFFKAAKDAGYGALLDTNDAIYGGYKAQSPVIVFDMEQTIPKSIRQTTLADKNFNRLKFAGMRALGL